MSDTTYPLGSPQNPSSFGGKSDDEIAATLQTVTDESIANSMERARSVLANPACPEWMKRDERRMLALGIAERARRIALGDEGRECLRNKR